MMNFDMLTDEQKANGTFLLEMLEPYRYMVGFPKVLSEAIRYNAQCPVFNLKKDSNNVVIDVKDSIFEDASTVYTITVDLKNNTITGEEPFTRKLQ